MINLITGLKNNFFISFLLLILLASCAPKSQSYKNKFGLDDSAYTARPGLVLNDNVFFNTHSFKLGLVWHPLLKEKAIIVVELDESPLYKYKDINGLEFIINKRIIKLEEYEFGTKHESGWGIGLNANLHHSSYSFKGFYMDISDMRSSIITHNEVAINLQVNEKIRKGDFKYKGYMTALRSFKQFIAYIDSI